MISVQIPMEDIKQIIENAEDEKAESIVIQVGGAILVESLMPSEALYAFAGWLTTKEKETVMGSHHDAAPIADLVKQFIETYALDDPREDWDKNLINMNKAIVK